MTPPFRRIFWFLLVLGSPAFLSGLRAESPDVSPAHTTQMPPMPPWPKAPVEAFRELLAMDQAGRDKYLSTRPPEIRKRFLAKIHEYEAMSPDERELRLRATELRWYLLPLMQTAPTNRAAQLATIPEADRQLVKDRLQRWDLLPPGLQKEFLEYGLTASYFVGKDADHADPPKNSIEKMLPPDLVKKMDYVSKLPPERRRAMYEGFQHFFELTDADKQKTLDALSPEERRQMQKTLQTFLRLPKAQRDLCLRSFGEFASMTEQERRGFFQNAERWKELSPAERQAWRNLVNRFPPMPPMPPMHPPMPPLPPTLRSDLSRPGVPVATNQSP